MDLKQVKAKITKVKKELREANALYYGGTLDQEFTLRWIRKYEEQLADLQREEQRLSNLKVNGAKK